MSKSSNRFRALFFVAILSVGLVSVTTPHSVRAKQPLVIFAAASLQEAFKEIATVFQAQQPEVELVFNFGSSATLATQLKEGAPADLFASANAKQLDVVREAGRIGGIARTFAKNRLVLIIPADNPAKINTLADLKNTGVKLVFAAKEVPVRSYTDSLLDRLVKNPQYGEVYRTAVLANVVSEEANVRQVATKISLGEADAGFVYQSDVTPDLRDKVRVIDIPDTLNTLAAYPIAVTNNAVAPELAEAFITYLLSDAGQDILVKWNFITVRIAPAELTITFINDGALHITGQVLKPTTLTVADLKANYTAQTQKVTFLSGENSTTATFTGVLLRDILDGAQINFNADVKNDKLSLFVVATGSDGYQAVVAWGEFDPDFGNQPILVAYEQDGAAIADKQGALRLVVPGDKRGSRYVSGLISLVVQDAPAVAKK